MLYVLGTAIAQQVITTGSLYEPREAVRLGFFDESHEADKLLSHCVEFAGQYGPSLIPGYAFSKRALRREVVANMEGACSEVDRKLPEILRSPGVLESIGAMVESLGKKKQ